MADIILDTNNCIGNGLPASMMRQSMENKNQLMDKGSMYVGTGQRVDVTINGQTTHLAHTNAIIPNFPDDNGKIIRYNSSTPLGVEIVDPSNGSSNFHSYFADNANLSAEIEPNDATNCFDVSVGCGLGETANFSIPMYTGTTVYSHIFDISGERYSIIYPEDGDSGLIIPQNGCVFDIYFRIAPFDQSYLQYAPYKKERVYFTSNELNVNNGKMCLYYYNYVQSGSAGIAWNEYNRIMLDITEINNTKQLSFLFSSKKSELVYGTPPAALGLTEAVSGRIYIQIIVKKVTENI